MDPLRRRAAPRRERDSQGGFAMIEALIAFAVLAVGLGTLAGGIAVALRADARGASTLKALRAAQALYAEIGVSTALAPQSNQDESGLQWRATVAPVGPAKPGPATASSSDAGPSGPPLVWLTVRVRDPGGGEAELAGLKLAPGQARAP